MQRSLQQPDAPLTRRPARAVKHERGDHNDGKTATITTKEGTTTYGVGAAAAGGGMNGFKFSGSSDGKIQIIITHSAKK